MKKVLLGLGGLLVLLVAVIVVRAYLAGTDTQVAEVDMPLSITVDAQAAAERLGEAIQFKTISSQQTADDPDSVDYTAFVDFRNWLAATYPGFHTTAEREVVGGYSLLFTWKGSDPSLDPILLMSHIDVVPVIPGTEDYWEEDAFSGKVSDGFIWGRGTIDTKGSLIAMVEAAELLMATGYTPKRTIMFAFGHDEEVGGPRGNVAIANLMKERGTRFYWVADEGGVVSDGLLPGVDGLAAMIGVAEKGYVTLELTAHAKGGHSSMPPKKTAIGRLVTAIDRLQRTPFIPKIDGATEQMVDAITGPSPFRSRLIMANRWLLDDVLISALSVSPTSDAQMRTTIAPTIIEGGSKENVLPPIATAKVNFRVHSRDSIADVVAHVKEAVDDPQVDVEIFNDAREPSFVSDTNTDGYSMLSDAIVASFDAQLIAPYLVVGGTDSRHYSEVADDIYRFIPIVMGKNDMARFHGTNERITVDNMGRAVEFYGRLLEAAGNK